MSPLNETHRAGLLSWVESANEPDADFPIQNLPFGVFEVTGGDGAPRVGVAIGDQILDVPACRREGLFAAAAAAVDVAAERCERTHLNGLMALGNDAVGALRRALSDLLRSDSPAYRRDPTIRHRILVPAADATLHLPVAIGDYTDFYASIHHATNVGRMLRPDNPLLPNYKYLPIGYHGRASSIVVSGTSVRRPAGQRRDDPGAVVAAGAGAPPVFGPAKRLDYEVEIGAYVGSGNPLGAPIRIDDAERHLFGLCLVNDWSARDIQSWEYQPLGPFLAKSFATTVSPWVVTLEALEPYRIPAHPRPEGDPAPLPYLRSAENDARGGVDIVLDVHLRTAAMRERGDPPARLSRGSFSQMYWTVAQLLAHHTSNGCNLRGGDLIASGTISGEAKDSRGCLLELTRGGKEPLHLPGGGGGETREFLHDGDEIVIRGFCVREGRPRIGFGECRGVVTPAPAADR